MKKSILILCLALFSVAAIAQDNVIDKHFAHYKAQDEFTKIDVTGKMFQLAAYLDDEASEDEDLKDFVEFVSSISAFHMIVGEEIVDAKSKYNNALGTMTSGYEELMSVNDKDGNFTFFIDENKGVVKEVVMVGAAEKHLIIFSLTGNMDLRQIAEMGSKLQGDGLSHMKKLKDKKLSEVKVYPNPVERGGSINVELPEELLNADMTIYDMNGAVKMTQKTTQRRLEVKANKLSAGQHVIEFRKAGLSIKRKVTIL